MNVVAWNGATAFVLLLGLWAVRKMALGRQMHHVWFALAAFSGMVTGAEWWRVIPLLLALDDATQHLVQVAQWRRRLIPGQSWTPPPPYMVARLYMSHLQRLSNKVRLPWRI